jgi:hypothetical protein
MIADLDTQPQYMVACNRCSHHASWIIPRPSMLPMVQEIAARQGWDGSGLCPVCVGRLSAAYAATKASWSQDEIEQIDRMRRMGWNWRTIAHHFFEHGHPTSNENTVQRVHRQRFRRLA